MTPSTTYGFVGLGDQGAPIARRVMDAGFPVVLWARRPQSVESFADTSATIAESLAAMARSSDVIGVCVRDDADVEATMYGDDGIFANAGPDTIVMIHSTVSPELCERLEADGLLRQIAVLDAPVSGGPYRAAEGTLAVMVGGDRVAYETVLPIVRTFSHTVEWLGPIGSGQLCKIVNNVLFTIKLGASLRLLEAGQRLGMDHDAMARMFSAGSGQSFALGIASSVGTEKLRPSMPLLVKDVGLFEAIVAGRGRSETEIQQLAQSTLSFFDLI